MAVYMRMLAIALWLLGMVACASAPSTELFTATPQITALDTQASVGNIHVMQTATVACPQTEPVWLTPPEDAAVQDPPTPGYYFVNSDRSVWVSAWWAETQESALRAGEEGIKVGWFRPAGAVLAISGQRTDAPAPPLEAHIPDGYPTRFQATELVFPSEGCWHITATAADRTLAFVVWVAP